MAKGFRAHCQPVETDMCLFHRLDQPQISINLFNTQIQSKNTISVLGVIFDNKLQWTAQVCNAIRKSNCSLCGINLIKKFFTKNELRTLLTAKFYSILYYNSEICHILALNPSAKQLLMAASAKALRLCINYHSNVYSYADLHKITQRANPNQMLVYKHAILLFKLFNSINSTSEWVNLNFQRILTSRQVNFMISKTNNYKIGSNLVCNRLTVLNNKIPLSWLPYQLNHSNSDVQRDFSCNNIWWDMLTSQILKTKLAIHIRIAGVPWLLNIFQ
jgi:hypothetical protein